MPLIKVDKAISAAPGVRVRNIEVFALVGPDQITKRDYLTLSEAIRLFLSCFLNWYR